MQAVDNARDLSAFHAALAQAEAIAMADMPMIPIMRQSARRLVSPRLRGWQDNAVDIHPARYLSRI